MLRRGGRSIETIFGTPRGFLKGVQLVNDLRFCLEIGLPLL